MVNVFTIDRIFYPFFIYFTDGSLFGLIDESHHTELRSFFYSKDLAIECDHDAEKLLPTDDILIRIALQKGLYWEEKILDDTSHARHSSSAINPLDRKMFSRKIFKCFKKMPITSNREIGKNYVTIF